MELSLMSVEKESAFKVFYRLPFFSKNSTFYKNISFSKAPKLNANYKWHPIERLTTPFHYTLNHCQNEFDFALS